MALRIPILARLPLGFLPVMASAAERPLVVELFTSQGCSSCPPATLSLMRCPRTDLMSCPWRFM
jgi:Protein of unknown function (DUF1223)